MNNLKFSIKKIIEKHSILRSQFIHDVNCSFPSHLKQKLIKTELKLEIIEDSENDKDLIDKQIKKEIDFEFDLKSSDSYLFKVKFIKSELNGEFLLFNFHHIIFDEWSIRVLENDLIKYYNDVIQDNIPYNSDFYDDSYQEYIENSHKIINNKSIEFWANYLTNPPESTQLPTDFNRPSIKSFQGSTISLDYNSNLFEKYCKRTNSTPFSVLLATFAVLVYRYTYQKDMIIGFPVTCRDNIKEESMIGSLINTVLIRFKLSNKSLFEDLLNTLKQDFIDILEHKNVPFENIVDKLGLKQNLSFSPLFQLIFTYESLSTSKIRLQDTNLESYTIKSSNTSKYDLNCGIVHTKDIFRINFEYDSELFREETVKMMMNNYIQLLDSITSNENKLIIEYNMLSKTEREMYLTKRCINPIIINDIKINEKIIFVHKQFEEMATEYPNNIAVCFKNDKISYEELNKKSNELADYFIKNTSIQTIIGISLDRSIDLIITIVACVKSGNIYVPLDPYYPSDRIDYMVNDSKTRLIICHKIHYSKFKLFNGEILIIDDFKYSQNWIESPNIMIEPDFIQYIIYTSGSTGRPKGVMVTHSNVSYLFHNIDKIFDFESSDVWTLFHSYSFDFSVWEIWGCLIRGARLVVVSFHQSRDSKLFSEIIIREKVSVLSQSPTAFQQLLSHEIKFNSLKLYFGLRLVIFGGERLNFRIIRNWIDYNGNLSTFFLNGYGPTECSVFSTFFLIDVLKHYSSKSIIGYPFPNSKAFILDKFLQPVPVNIVGEIYIGGYGVSKGYLNQNELTEQKFIESPFSKNMKLYKSGDLGRYLFDGSIEYIGRIDYQVKINGFRIELGEIEAQIYSTNIVEEVIVIAFGPKNNQRLVAYIVLKNKKLPLNENEQDIFTQEIVEKIKQFLPKFMLPSSFMFLSNFARTENGKINRNLLPEPNYFYIEKSSNRVKVAPKSDIEITVVNILSELLSIKFEDISLTDNVFNLGINSIMVIQLINKINFLFNYSQLTTRNIYEKYARIMYSKYIIIWIF